MTNAAPGSEPADEPHELVAALLTPQELGIPADWAVRDIDRSVGDADSLPAEALDPFLGLLRCSESPVPGGDDDWLARRYSAPEVPLENGMLSVDISILEETADSAGARAGGLDDCEAPEFGQLRTSATDLLVAGSETAAVALELLSPPSSSVPYPAAFNATVAHRDGYTVVIVLGGIDMGVSWAPLADEVAAAVLERMGVLGGGLASTPPIPSAADSPSPAVPGTSSPS